MSDGQTTFLQDCLDRLRAGDPRAQSDLIEAACERLRRLARSMLGDYRRLKRWEDTDDVLQNAVVRLGRALTAGPPASPREFFRLAALQIRRELIDLSRRRFGPEGLGANHATDYRGRDESRGGPPAHERGGESWEPSKLAAWGEFHERVSELPDDEREAFELIWYQGLKHAEAAALLDVSTKTIQRRWHSACLALHAALDGELPAL